MFGATSSSLTTLTTLRWPFNLTSDAEDFQDVVHQMMNVLRHWSGDEK
jgi:hypothetical protein